MRPSALERLVSRLLPDNSPIIHQSFQHIFSPPPSFPSERTDHLVYDLRSQILAASPPYLLVVIQNMTFPTAVDVTASKNHQSSSVKLPSFRSPSSSSIICLSICNCNAHTTALASSVPCRDVTVLTRLIMSLVSPLFKARSSLS